MGSWPLQKIAEYVLLALVALIFFGFYFGYEGGAFGTVKDLALGLKNYTFSKLPLEIGSQEIKGTTTTLSSSQLAAVRSLTETIAAMKESGESGGKNCFAQYTPLPYLGKEKGTKITLSYDQKAKATNLVVTGGQEGMQEVFSERLEGVQPCVIAGQGSGGEISGEKTISRNFYSSFLAKNPSLTQPLSLPVQSITIAGATKIGRADMNTLSYDGSEPIELLDGGWLFTPSAGKICFFPSEASGNAEKGLDPVYLSSTSWVQAKGTEIEEESIPFLVRSGKLSLCESAKKEKEWKIYQSLDIFDDLTDDFPVKTIRQACEGLVGVDCAPKGYKTKQCTFSHVSQTQRGCYVMASAAESNVLTNDLSCGRWEAAEGTILTDDLEQAYQFNENEISSGLFFEDSSHATAIETVLQRKWLSLARKALLCAGNQWYECSDASLEKELTMNGVRYLCTEENGIIQWREK